tara:strand:- start:325 stop:480 length:156 start_codon:yes stop_codon:yes gene_type:complete
MPYAKLKTLNPKTPTNKDNVKKRGGNDVALKAPPLNLKNTYAIRRENIDKK